MVGRNKSSDEEGRVTNRHDLLTCKLLSTERERERERERE